MTTIQTIVDLARVPLNDDAKTRYTDAKALLYANSAIAEAYRVRPDLKFGSYEIDYAELGLGGTFPLPIRYAQPVADYITGRMGLIDDEASADRAAALIAEFRRVLQEV